MTTTVNNAAGRVQIFTVDAGETHRVFVVNQGHATINNLNSSFTDSRTHLINTVDTAQFGSIRITSVSERPELAAGSRDVLVGSTRKFDNLAQLNIWGIVYVESSGAGFAMEFIGDAQDSTIGGAANIQIPRWERRQRSSGNANADGLARPARGIN